MIEHLEARSERLRLKGCRLTSLINSLSDFQRFIITLEQPSFALLLDLALQFI
jgi:hypothetical protein